MSAYQTLHLNQCQIIHKEGKNFIDISYVENFTSRAVFTKGNFSIKYVSEGTETYRINQNKYIVQSKEYILANHFFRGWIEVDKATKGICIDLDLNLISEVLSFFLKNDSEFPFDEIDSFFNGSGFLDNKYDARQTRLGACLIELDDKFKQQHPEKNQITKDFYYTLAENLIEDHLSIYKQLQSVSAAKISTKNDIYKKIQRGRMFIDENFQQDIDVESVAKESCLSEYHFFRTFKNIMGISPYQYLIQKRLKYAELQIQKDAKMITEIAIESGFADVFSFSKSFKKSYGVSPKTYHKLYFKS